MFFNLLLSKEILKVDVPIVITAKFMATPFKHVSSYMAICLPNWKGRRGPVRGKAPRNMSSRPPFTPNTSTNSYAPSYPRPSSDFTAANVTTNTLDAAADATLNLFTQENYNKFIEFAPAQAGYTTTAVDTAHTAATAMSQLSLDSTSNPTTFY